MMCEPPPRFDAPDDVAVLASVRSAVTALVAGWDASHDIAHMERVSRTALAIALEEGFAGGELLVVTLAALLHDVDDAKYCGGGDAGPPLPRARDALAAAGVAPPLVERVCSVISCVSYSAEAARRAATPDAPEAPLDPAAAVVQDADRLDAIGAIGIARCFTYGGARGRTLHDGTPTGAGTTIGHFHDKLLRVAALMKTRAGARRAAARHALTADFLQHFVREWDGLE